LDKIFIIQDPTATVIIPPHHTENLSEVQKVPRVQENLPDPAILALMTTEIAAVVGNLASAAAMDGGETQCVGKHSVRGAVVVQLKIPEGTEALVQHEGLAR